MAGKGKQRTRNDTEKNAMKAMVRRLSDKTGFRHESLMPMVTLATLKRGRKHRHKAKIWVVQVPCAQAANAFLSEWPFACTILVS